MKKKTKHINSDCNIQIIKNICRDLSKSLFKQVQKTAIEEYRMGNIAHKPIFHVTGILKNYVFAIEEIYSQSNPKKAAK